MINREQLTELVSVFYQPPFKTFYVNSVDSQTFTRPVGVFVSLGITTAMRVLEDLKNVIISSGGEYDAVVAEISSEHIGSQFLNTLTNIDNPQQYLLDELPEGTMTREEAVNELESMNNQMVMDQSLDVLKSFAPKISKLQDLISKLDNTNGWGSHLIQREGNSYRIFHRYINYRRSGSIEYRLGIYVTKRNS